MDADKSNREKAWRQLHKNPGSCIEHVQEADPQISIYTSTYIPSLKPSK